MGIFMKLFFSSLGCSKNLVDSEIMLSRLMNAGWEVISSPEQADVIVVNTCSFITSASDESIDTILELAKCKTNGRCQRLIVTGCLPQRYGKKTADALPEVDVFLGTGAYTAIVEAVEGGESANPRAILPDPDSIGFDERYAVRTRSSSQIAYIKVAEGCSRHCTYCIIPKLRGRHRSRPLTDIITETEALLTTQTREFLLVAQDTTAYGRDLVPSIGFDRLLQALSDRIGDRWLRYLYGHPESIDEAAIKTIGRCNNICSYFDIPIQHASNAVLKRMGRHYSRDDLYRLYETIHHHVPQASLRTTVIVGFPGETDTDVDILLDFLQDIEFHHLGVFLYSDAEDLASHRLSGQIDSELALERFDAVMDAQSIITQKKNAAYIGRTVPVLVEEKAEEGIYRGRTMFQAPEVDGITYIFSEHLSTGHFYDVRITKADDYDLTGVIA